MYYRCRASDELVTGSKLGRKLTTSMYGGNGSSAASSNKAPLGINVNGLVLRTSKWYVTAPLVGHNSPVHCSANNTKSLHVKKELWGKAARLERHGEKRP